MTRRIGGVLRDIIVPLSLEVDRLPARTTFSFTGRDTMLGILDTASRDCPVVLSSREEFLAGMAELYDAYKGGQAVAPPTATTGQS